ncbi:hypothetical protein HDU96_008853 [Phlyctochytrium bullatum]|nr:hypothetical protein HDU96_008853 [Phlyctochytrium bullatum]
MLHTVALVAALAVAPALVSAHGRLQVPTPLNTDFERLNNNNICGRGVNLNGNNAVAATFTAGATQSLTWFVLNGDGAGPLTVKVDPTGTGNFGAGAVDAVITKQVPGQNGNIGNSGLRSNAPTDFEIQIPNVQCAAKGCLMQVKQSNNGGFGSCAFIQINGGTGAAPPPPPPPPAAPPALPPANKNNNNNNNNNNQGAAKNNNQGAAKNNNNNGGAAKNLGSCSPDDAKITVGLGADPAGERAQEVRAITSGRGVFAGQQSALNTAIVGNFICDRLGDQCRADAAVVSACRTAVGNLKRGGKNLGAAALQEVGQAADDFNKALGITTNFAADLVRTGGGAAANNGGNNNNNNQGGAAKNNNNNNGGNNNAGGGAAKNLGSCSPDDAKITVGLGADPAGERAQEVRAITSGRGVFAGQQSALNTAIVGNFICDRLGDQCRADAAVVSACRTAVGNLKRGGKNLSAAALQEVGKAADDFNKALGITTNFAADLVRTGGGNNAGNNGGNNGGMGGNNNNNNNNGGNNGGNAGGNNLLGSCKPDEAAIFVGKGSDPSGDRREEFRAVTGANAFGLTGSRFNGQASALANGIVGNFICDRLGSDCRADASVISACRAAQGNLRRGGKNLGEADLQALGKAADDFNKALGITTNFAQLLLQNGGVVDARAVQAAINSGRGNAAGLQQGAGNNAGNNAGAAAGGNNAGAGNNNVGAANAADATKLLEQALALLNSL